MTGEIETLWRKHIVSDEHVQNDYFGLIKKLVEKKQAVSQEDPARREIEAALDKAYALLGQEIATNQATPLHPVSFGTSGWRGILGKDLFCRSVAQVTQAICEMYQEIGEDPELASLLGVSSAAEARERGCVVAHDNRFGGETLKNTVIEVLTSNGFKVFDAGEASTGTVSAAVLTRRAAFSINLTPSHNPLEYGGFKFNGADAGPAASQVTGVITRRARRIIDQAKEAPCALNPSLVTPLDALACWLELVRENAPHHRIDYDALLARIHQRDDLVVVADCVHGSSRLHIRRLLPGLGHRLVVLRDDDDPTFGGIAPEPSSANLAQVVATLQKRPERLKLGVIIDPDADRIRFTDGRREIDMNLFGALAYFFLHERKGLKGMVAKSVATSNFANAVAKGFQEEVFETRVGFKEFKPVIGKALVCFEESDGISVIGHTPEKDAYIGLVLALDIITSENENLSTLLDRLTRQFGAWFPARDGVTVSLSGEALKTTLSQLDRFEPGTTMEVEGRSKTVQQLITIDGHKLVFTDGSWLMIRPSGTEPKVRFYVEGRSAEERDALLAAARHLLRDLGLLS